MNASQSSGPVVGRASSRRGSATNALARIGVLETVRAEGLLEELRADGIELGSPDEIHDGLGLLAGVADPDQALLALVRIAATSAPELKKTLADDGGRHRLMALLGGSAALGDHLARHGQHMAVIRDGDSALVRPAEQVMADLLTALGADPKSAQPVATVPDPVNCLRLAYRRRLVEITCHDLASHEPEVVFPYTAAALADLATGTLEAALAIARSEVADADKVRLAVLALGKCGGRELNYVSDVDVIYVAEPAPGVPETEALRIATDLATHLQRACSSPGTEPDIWQVDPNLRPEGRNGPLVRTLESHRLYYERWAKFWEFQALLKARPAAGDRELAQRYCAMTQPLVWACVERDGFVEDAQAMRRRVEQNVPPAEAERQIKLGRGGLRDVEFTVQLLQLVHGRLDPTLHSANTLEALEALAAGGYVGRADAEALSVCYRQLRVLEHRVQVFRLRRSHLLPTAEADLRRLARAARLTPANAATLTSTWKTIRRQVRSLHQEVFYRPLLPETARLTAAEATLAPAAAQRRLTALGYRDPVGAMRHLAALTEGVSRRAAIQRQLLPVMLGWFAEGADADGGLLSFRRLSEALGATPWYLRMLRDSAGAAAHLSHVLATSRYVANGLTRSPDSVLWFGDDAQLRPPDPATLAAEITSLTKRQTDPTAAAREIRGVRRRELIRVGAAILLGTTDTRGATRAASDIAEVTIAGGLRLAEMVVLGGAVPGFAGATTAPAALAVIAMGSLGGREMGLASDADVLFVHQTRPGVSEAEAQAYAVAVAGQMRNLLGKLGTEPALVLDADLRPEGRVAPLCRSVAAYREYYQRWALPWERQALLRARPVAGDSDLASTFIGLINTVRYQAHGMTETDLIELRRIKARVEAERLPRGVEPTRHLKLGPGGLLDVQWIAQLLTLQQAGKHPALQQTGTLEALQAAADDRLLAGQDLEALVQAWIEAMRLRNANLLWTGKISTAIDVLPHDRRALAGLARILGYEPGQAAQLEEDHLRRARHARVVFERVFFD